MARRSVLLFILQLVLLAFALPGNIVMARVLGPEARGVLGVLSNGVLLLVTVANLSFGTGLLVGTAKGQFDVRQATVCAAVLALAVWLASVVVLVVAPWIRTNWLFLNTPASYVWLLLFTQFPSLLLS